MTNPGVTGRLRLPPRCEPPEWLWLGGVFLSAALLLLFGWLAEEVAEGDTQSFDRRIILLFRCAGHPEQLLGGQLQRKWISAVLERSFQTL